MMEVESDIGRVLYFFLFYEDIFHSFYDMEESSEKESAEKCERESTELIACEPMSEKPALTHFDTDIEDQKYHAKSIELRDHFSHLIIP